MWRLAVLLSVAAYCVSHPGYRLAIPNGINVPNPCPKVDFLWNGVGHNMQIGGGPLNVFGKAFNSTISNGTWTQALCEADSDTDGKTNGQELGDPNCTWKVGQPYPGNATGHPGVCEPMTDDKCKSINKKIVCHAFFPQIILPD